MKNDKIIKIFALVELAGMVLFVSFDILMPTILIVLAGLLFLMLRKEKFAVLDFHKLKPPVKVILSVFGFTLLWTLIDFGIIIPLLNHLTGMKQDVSTFKELQGNGSLLAFMLIASWTLAAFGEELAYRGIVQNRIISLFSDRRIGIVAAVAGSSVLFGFAHTEQGVIGIIVSAIDAAFYSIIKYKYKNLWASVLAHGFMNSIGVITFYFTGPIYGLW